MSIVLETQTPSYTTDANQEYAFGQHVKDVFNRYTSALNGETPKEVYTLFLGEFEKPFLEAVLSYTRHNQSKAAIMLGLSRGTLRKKLKQYDLL